MANWASAAVVLVLAGWSAPVFPWPHDPGDGLPVCTAADNQFEPQMISDGDGGAILVWRDFRSGSDYDIYAQRVVRGGEPIWNPNGVSVCDQDSMQFSPAIVSDGSGGAIIAWVDYRSLDPSLYVQHLDPDGIAQWAPNGFLVANAPGIEQPVLVSDGAGGAIAVWTDERSGDVEIYASKITAALGFPWGPNGLFVIDLPGVQSMTSATSDGAGGVYVAVDDFGGSDLDVYAQWINHNATMNFGNNGMVISTAGNDQTESVIVADGLGGAIIAWRTGMSGISDDIFAQRIDKSGTLKWFSAARACEDTTNQSRPAIATDGSHGAVITWEDSRGGDSDIYAQRVSVTGYLRWLVPGLWDNGVPVCKASGYQFDPQISASSEGDDAVLITWMDQRAGAQDIYGQKMDVSNVSWFWKDNGVAICTAPFDQLANVHVTDGAGGMIAAWHDQRNGTTYDIFAQRVEVFGNLGDPTPFMVSVEDVPNDQGGSVKLSWGASYLDLPPYGAVEEYWIWRSAPPNAVAEALARGARFATDIESCASILGFGLRPIMAVPTQQGVFYWEYLTQQPAGQLDVYSYVAPTTGDSVGSSNPKTAFMIQARSYSGVEWWNSNPDSGYSVDNLAPNAPAPFSGEYLGGTTALHWGVSPETDLLEYRLYRGKDAGFMPGSGNLVTVQSDTGYVDTAGEPYFYKLSAVDIHGNESPFAFLQPTGTVEIPGGPRLPTRFALYAATPNPIRESALIRFDLPVAASVQLAIYDARGRMVRRAIDGATMAAGRYDWKWDLRSDSGTRLTPGVYFYTLRTGVFTQTHKAVLID
jgi:hypothetical protein